MAVLGMIIRTYTVVAIIHEGSNYIHYYSAGTGVIINMATTFNGDFGATGYVYAIDLQ